MSKKNIIIVAVIGIISTIAFILYFTNLKEENVKEFKITFEDNRCDSRERPVYEYPYSNLPLIASNCGQVYYTDDKNDKITLEKAMDDNLITFEDIIRKMKVIDSDSYATIYEYNTKNNDLSDINFRIEVCEPNNRSYINQFYSYAPEEYHCFKKEQAEKNFTIELENGRCNSKEQVIHTYTDERKIYSRCGQIYYNDKNSKKITLGEAIEKDIIRIKDISNKMEIEDAVFDGGTVIYEYNKKSNTLSNSSFRLEVCNKINGKRDQLFLSIHSNNYKCA